MSKRNIVNSCIMGFGYHGAISKFRNFSGWLKEYNKSASYR
jgi:hypothetical protein